MSSNFKPKPQCFIPGCAVTNEWNKRLFFKMSFGDLPHWWKTTAWAAKYNTEVPENALICERHFEERFIDRTRKKPRLMAGTIPTMNLCSIEMTDDNDLNNLEYFCRLCAKRGFEKMRYRLEELSEMTDVVQCCLGRYQTVTGLPDGVCETCICMMKKFSNFVQQCEDSQLQIIQLQTKLKKELEGDRETTTEDHLNVNANKENTDTKEQMESSTRKRKSKFFPEGKPCPDCGKIFKTHARYYHHRRNHNEQLQGFGCQICEKIFTRRDGLRRHLDHVHGGKMKPKCIPCDEIFANKSLLKKHQDNAHNDGDIKPIDIDSFGPIDANVAVTTDTKGALTEELAANDIKSENTN